MTDELEAELAELYARLEAAWQLQNRQGRTTRATRKPPADTLRSLRRWRRELSAGGAITVQRVVADGTARQCGRPVQTAPPTSSAQRESPVPVAPSTTVRIPEDLRERVDEYGREHRWTFGEVTRVALEQLVGYEPQPRTGEATSRSNAW